MRGLYKGAWHFVILVVSAVAVNPNTEQRLPSLLLTTPDECQSDGLELRRGAPKLSVPRTWRELQSSVEQYKVDDDLNHQGHGSASFSLPTHPDIGLDHLFIPLNQTCHPECTKRGNCNAEEGRCECPFGYTGPSCEEPLMPACQVGPMQEVFFGFLVPRSCECMRQAYKFFGCSEEAETCTMEAFFYRNVKCYEFEDKPASEQWSAMPTVTAPNVQYFEGEVRTTVHLWSVQPYEGVVGTDLWGTRYLNLPLERCGETRCHDRGACVAQMDSGDEAKVLEADKSATPHCLCYKGYVGHSCGDTLAELCPNRCRNNGSCLRGFCHCKPPYWGLDCSRQHAWQLAPGAVPVPNRQLLRIYVYDLPANVAFPVPLDDNLADLNEPSYQTHRKFLDLLLSDPTVRTGNPLEANLFFVPAIAYSYSSNTRPPRNQIASALRYVQQHYPYFNASGGRDHFVWTTGDKGSCYLPQNLSRVIHITLFGLHSYLYDNHTTFLKPQPKLHPGFGCFHPRKDVLAAPWYDHMVGSADAPELYRKLVEDKGEDPDRNLLFFFAGSVRPKDLAYSGGARQALAAHLKTLLNSTGGGNYSDIMFVEGFTPDYEALYRRSKFCIAPHGAGFGVRLTLAMTHACVPVIIQDQVYQPYESDGILPYNEFSIRLSMSDVPHIVPILRAVRPERLTHMRLAMARYHRAFLWNPELGGRAYNYTIRALKQRLHGLWGHLWGEPHEEGTARHHRHHHRFRRLHQEQQPDSQPLTELPSESGHQQHSLKRHHRSLRQQQSAASHHYHNRHQQQHR